MNKNKKIKILLFCLLIFITICTCCLLINSCSLSKKTLFEKSDFHFDKGIEVTELELKREEKSYILSFDIKKEDNIDFNSNDYSVYLFDSDNNLLKKYSGATMGSFSNSNLIRVTYRIVVDISSLDRVVVAKKDDVIKYNKDLSSELEYIGIDNKTKIPLK